MRARGGEVPTWGLGGFAAVPLLAAGLRLWRLGESGYGNPYYAAGVRSMLANWRNFFFASYDPAGVIVLDKPPVAFWVQAASAKLLGFSGFSILLPQAPAGVASVLLIYHPVRRGFGVEAFVLVLAARPMFRAAETGRLRSLLLSMALVGGLDVHGRITPPHWLDDQGRRAGRPGGAGPVARKTRSCG